MDNKTIIKVIIHSLFWVFYIFILFLLIKSKGVNNLNWYNKPENHLLLLVFSISYLNDQVFLPHLLKKKYYIVYTLTILGLLFLATYFFCYYIFPCKCGLLACFSTNLWYVSLPLIFLSFIWVVLEFSKKQNELDKAHSDKVESELKFLKAQINPHVLFNSLNTIYAKSVKENDEIAELILILSENLKYVLNQSNDTFVDIEKEITFIENYLEFQKLRTQGINNIIYTKEVDSYNHSIAPLILIDFIENAFKYSIYKDEELSNVTINLSIKNGKVHFTCMNEFDSANTRQENYETTQIGLKNLKQRLELIYKNKYMLNINKDNGVFIVDLKIDLE